MKKSKRIIFLGIIILFIAMALIVFLAALKLDNTLEFTVIDQVSKSWVWDLTVTLQDRILRGFYQSDLGPVPFKFTHLAAGDYEMKLSAPSYTDVTIPVTIKRGKYILPETITMQGYEIPGFSRFFVFIKQEGNDIILQLHQADADNTGIKNHPCIDLWVGCKIYVQIKDGIFVKAPTKSGSQTGKLLFMGKIPWEWDPSPENLYHYTARIKGTAIEKHNSPYRVYEYVVVIPDPRKVTPEELEREITPLLDLDDMEEFRQQLEKIKGDRFQYFMDSKWNVPALR